MIIAQFTRTLATLVKSALPLLEGLKVAEKTVSNFTIKKMLQEVAQEVSRGKLLSEPLKEAGIFPIMVIQMVSVGENTGKLEQVLFDIADFYEQEIDYVIKEMSSIVEPILLLVMGVMVGFIALSVLLPIFNLVKIFKH
jgi:type IV pilus assembly protein PilC